MKTKIRQPPVAEAQILKSRYDEAVRIKDAWDYRLRWAQSDHAEATKYGGDTDATARNIRAVEIHVTDAATELQIARTAWMTATTNTERRTA
jgi:hypothetical protein